MITNYLVMHKDIPVISCQFEDGYLYRLIEVSETVIGQISVLSGMR